MTGRPANRLRFPPANAVASRTRCGGTIHSTKYQPTSASATAWLGFIAAEKIGLYDRQQKLESSRDARLGIVARVGQVVGIVAFDH